MRPGRRGASQQSGSSVADALNFGAPAPRQRPGTRPDSLSELPRQEIPAAALGELLPRVPAAAANPDSLDQFRRGLAPPQYGEPYTGDPAGPSPQYMGLNRGPSQMSDASSGQLAQLMARVSSLERQNAGLKQVVERQQADILINKQTDQTTRTLARQLHDIDEALRRASNAHDTSSKRIRNLEDSVGGGSGNLADRVAVLESTAQSLQQQSNQFSTALTSVVTEQHAMQGASETAVAGLDEKLEKKVEYALHVISDAVGEEQQVRRQLDENWKQALSQSAGTRPTPCVAACNPVHRTGHRRCILMCDSGSV